MVSLKPGIPSVKAQDDEDLVDPQQTLRVLCSIFCNRSFGRAYKRMR